MEKKTIVEDIKRDLYDIKNPDKDSYHITRGLTKPCTIRSKLRKADDGLPLPHGYAAGHGHPQ